MEIISNSSSNISLKSKSLSSSSINISSSFDTNWDLIENLPSPPTLEGPFKEIEEWIYKCSKASPIRKILKDFTPLTESTSLSLLTKNKIFYKREECSPVNSFKLRGSFTKISCILKEARENGLYTCSAGNHAQGVAYSSNFYGISSKIYMPKGAPTVKINKVKSLGSEIVLCGETLDDCFTTASDIEKNRILIHPFDDIYIIGGTATISLELIEQIDMQTIDYIFCPCGGGGLISGIGIILKKFYPNLKIIGVESIEAPGMTLSLSNKSVKILKNIGKFADGTAIKKIGDFNFEICKNIVENMVTVTTAEICKAISDAFTDLHSILEPSGALGIAGLKKFINENKIQDTRCIVITTGSNVDFNLVRFISEMADTTERVISLLLPEYPGSFKKFFALITNCEITGIAYHKSYLNPFSNITLCTRINPEEEISVWMDLFNSHGYSPLEITGDHFANYHGRFFTCTRNIFSENERLLRFEYYNSGNRLNVIFDFLPLSWDLSLVHYRHYGSDMCSLLISFTFFDNTTEFKTFLENIKKFDIFVSDETNNPFISRLLESW